MLELEEIKSALDCAIRGTILSVKSQTTVGMLLLNQLWPQVAPTDFECGSASFSIQGARKIVSAVGSKFWLFRDPAELIFRAMPSCILHIKSKSL